jgi:hypothetical protein
MNEMAKDLSEDDLQSIAGLCEKQPAPKPPADPVDTARLDRARALVEQNHCNVATGPIFPGKITCPGSLTSVRITC